jgi:hypothetical protein
MPSHMEPNAPDRTRHATLIPTHATPKINNLEKNEDKVSSRPSSSLLLLAASENKRIHGRRVPQRYLSREYNRDDVAHTRNG